MSDHPQYGKLIGQVAVDSGQVIIVDPSYVLEGQYDDMDSRYGRVCHVTIGAEGRAGQWMASGTGGKAVASSTTYGDGLYPVYAVMDEKRGAPRTLTIDMASYWEDDLDRAAWLNAHGVSASGVPQEEDPDPNEVMEKLTGDDLIEIAWAVLEGGDPKAVVVEVIRREANDG